jgi:aarF domain-containing kinase
VIAGLYTEMDFRNEALNAMRMQELLSSSEHTNGFVIPAPILELTSR